MKKQTLVSILFLLLFVGTACSNKYTTNTAVLRNGDLVFQESQSSQCKAVKAATHSKYSHCGIIYKHNNVYYVYEAIQPVSVITLDEWIKRGKDQHYVVKRLINADEILTPDNITKMEEQAKLFYGKNYDLTFEWSDDKIYCSELIWKIYKRATGLEIGKLQKLGDFDLTSDIVKQKLVERYGNRIPLEETVISPAAIFESDLLETVYSN
ncbi:MAG: YiiX family permuted papain-like enzyme [Dysgonomonas sp.]